MSVLNDIIKSNSILLILSCLVREPMHGYRIGKEIGKVTNGYFPMGEGTLYPHLRHLEQEGLIEVHTEIPSGDRVRKVCRITDKGSAEFARRVREWRDYQAKVECLLVLAAPGNVD